MANEKDDASGWRFEFEDEAIEEGNLEAPGTNEAFTRKTRIMVFAVLCAMQIFLNYDSGALAFLMGMLQVSGRNRECSGCTMFSWWVGEGGVLKAWVNPELAAGGAK